MSYAYLLQEVLNERVDWRLECSRKEGLIIPAAEFERTEFVKHPYLWYYFFRVILHDPITETFHISGIRPSPLTPEYHYHVLTDFKKARLVGNVEKEDLENRKFSVAEIFRPDRKRQEGKVIGFAVHAHCWLLVDQVIGHNIVERNLRAFTESVRRFWRSHYDGLVKNALPPHSYDCCIEYNLNNLYPTKIVREYNPWWTWGVHIQRSHRPGNPFRIPEIQQLIAKVTKCPSGKKGLRPGRYLPPISDLPLDIALNIMDYIYADRPLCWERLDDVRNSLEVLQWKLPVSYWVPRCNSDIFFEVDTLVKAGHEVDWEALCLGMEELVLDREWCCTSGLNYRCLVLNILRDLHEELVLKLCHNAHG
ncbi:hypothetical protein BO70DRAFT_425494 [Aspergillus heteromorphus CBS 117.55]|uniref:Uncharacterized protein n=1 Tax=Aspergillus heteromorphus CBS 117.55 TaxID=1448321 RepID=A0A317X3C1_9EURO|nr:uncharacterized protein BO70DRAFT_425494 [Aspergillus heteromorphus CBS 117.55]PWY92835.1 hypothetical protein BO70DRAFT_425494 [Aspergillus heteromorphus CBS 117.55]